MNIKKFTTPKYLLLIFAVVFLTAEFDRSGDFNIFLLASEALSNGENIYTRSYVSGFQYFYSPLFAVLITPLSSISRELTSLLWNAAGFLMLARVFWLIYEMFLPHSKRELKKVQILVFVVTLFPIFCNFHLTQMTAFILFSILESINQIMYKKRVIFGAAILALAINIKILPVVIIPYLLYRGEFKAIVFTFLFIGLYLIAPALVLGMETNIELHTSWMSSINPTKSENIIDLDERGLHGISSLVSALFTDYRNNFELTFRRHLVILDENTIGEIINGVRMILILLTLYLLRTMPFKESPSRLNQFWEISYICLLIPLIFPHQQLYAFLLILPATYYVVSYLVNINKAFDQKWKRYLISGMAYLAFLIINLELIIGIYRHHLWYFKTLTYGVLLLLVVLVICNPSYLKQEEVEQT